MRPTLNTEKLKQLPTTEQILDEKYGGKGSSERETFDAKALAWYYAEILKKARKNAGLTQKELAEKIGKKREYIVLLEKGETDMQLSTFLLIVDSLGLTLNFSEKALAQAL